MKMKRLLGLVSCLAWLWGLLPAQNTESQFERVTDVFDFEGGSVGPWSSYPPAQDTAYDPTIWVKKVPGNDSWSLVREIIPNRPIDTTFGVRKKLNIFVDRESRISFRYAVKNYGKTDGVIIKLGLADGSSHETKLPAGENEAWLTAEFALSGLPGLERPKKLAAVAIMAVCLRADPETRLKLAVDDVTISGWRPKTFLIQEPPVHRLEEFSLDVAGVHFEEGSDVRIRGTFPGDADSGEVEISDVFGERRPLSLPLKKRPGHSFEALISSRRFGPGLWRAEISGRRGSVEFSPASLVFLVRSKTAPREHPWLLLTRESRKSLEKSILSGRPREIWEKLGETARSLRAKHNPADFNYNLDAYDEVFWLPTYSGYAGTIRTLASYARANALVYGLSGDREAGDAARRALLKMAEWPSYVHPHILNQGQFTYWPAGLVLLDLALGYDLVYDLLAPEERKTIAASLFHKGVTEVFKEYVRDNRVSSDTSNWISHVAGGGILSALAVAGEYKDAELEPYLSGMILKVAALVRSTFDRDGHYGEGYAYHNFTMQTLSEIMPVLETHFGIAFPEKVFRSHLYLPYQMNAGSREIYDFGDTGNKLAPLSNFAYVLKKTRDPLLRWLYDLAPGNADVDLLYYDDAVRPESPSLRLPLTKLFRDTGTAVFRSGFSDDDFLFVFRAGPFYNHQHFDQGSFFLRDQGRNFIVEGGRTGYYDDPWYQGFFIQPGGHNCLLPDGNEECQRAGDLLNDVPAWQDYARITDFLAHPEGVFLSAELAPLYQGKFRTLRRSILYLAPRTVILIDRSEGAEGVEKMNLRFHAPRRDDIKTAAGTAVILRGGRSLLIRTLMPSGIRAEIRKRPLSLSEFGAENPITMTPRGFLELSADIQKGRSQVVNVLGTEGKAIQNIRSNEKDDCLELAIEGSRYFISRTEGQPYEADGIVTNAQALRLQEGGLAALRVSEIRAAGRTIFRSELPVSILLKKGEHGMEMRAWSSEPARVQIDFPSKPRTVTMNGLPFQTWSYADSRVGLTIPAESSTFQLQF